MRTKLLFISTFLFFALAIVAAQHPQFSSTSFQNTSPGRNIFYNPTKNMPEYIAKPEDDGDTKEVKTNVLIYPNPSNGNFTVILENKRAIQNLEVYNVIGERILQQHLSNQVSIPNAQTGIYFVKIDDGVFIYTKRITVQ
jgi:hypothetical protein